MFTATCPLVLASASPRRRQLLESVGLTCAYFPADIDERSLAGEDPAAFAQRMAMAKAEAIAAEQAPSVCVIGADTVVTIGGRILGKPKDQHEALHFLELLNGASHTVITGYALVAPFCDLKACEHVSTRVHFGAFEREVLQAYARSKEPLDKAGAYAIQGAGCFLVSTIEGSSTNVIGLPMQELLQLLMARQIIRPALYPL